MIARIVIAVIFLVGPSVMLSVGAEYEHRISPHINKLEESYEGLVSSNSDDVIFALSSLQDIDDPRVVSLLESMWLDKKYDGLNFSRAINDPLVRLEIARVILFQSNEPKKIYEDYIFEQLNSNNLAVKKSAITSLTAVFDNRAVAALKTIILSDNTTQIDAVYALGAIAIAADPNRVDALKELSSIANDKSLGSSVREHANKFVDDARNLQVGIRNRKPGSDQGK